MYSLIILKWSHRTYSLQSFQFIWKPIFYKYSTFWCSKISPLHRYILVVKGFMNNSSPRSLINSQANHTCNMIEMSLHESLSSIKWINPYHHILLIEFIWKFKEIPCCFRCFFLMYMFNFIQIFSITLLMHLIIHQEKFLWNMLFVNLIGYYIRWACIHFIFILLSNNSSPGIYLP